MKKLALTVLMASTILATGCETIPSSESVDMSKTTGMVIGSITGAVLGNQVGDGNGKTLATIVAAIGGGYLGGELAGDDDTQVSQKASTPQRNTPEYMNNTRSTVKTSSSSNKLCHKKVLYDKTINMDVDLAYVKFKRAFDYKTRSEKLIEAGLDPNCTDDLMCRFDQGFKHYTQPGISYKMNDQVHLDSGYYLGWLSIELEKAGSQKTMVFVKYCEGGTEGFDSEYTQIINNKIKKIYL